MKLKRGDLKTKGKGNFTATEPFAQFWDRLKLRNYVDSRNFFPLLIFPSGFRLVIGHPGW
jgi:hypothetical protein